MFLDTECMVGFLCVVRVVLVPMGCVMIHGCDHALLRLLCDKLDLSVTLLPLVLQHDSIIDDTLDHEALLQNNSLLLSHMHVYSYSFCTYSRIARRPLAGTKLSSLESLQI